MKKLILGSVVVAALVFTGCGSDDDTPMEDTTAPVITTSATPPPVAVGGTVALTATDENTVTFTESSAMFSIVGSALKPEFVTGTNSVVVTATDTAGNHSDKNITVTIQSGTLTFDSVEDNRTTWAVADAACTSAGKRLPTMEELNTTVLPVITFPTNSFISVLWTSSDDLDANGDVVADTKIGAWYKNGVDVTPEALPRLLTEHDIDDNVSTPDAEFTYYHTCVQ